LAVLDDSGWTQGFDAPPIDMRDIQQQAAREILQEGVSDLASLGVFANGHLTIGQPLIQIPLLADELKVDLIVLGHHKRAGLAR
ncbi:universal stress protein, partial [Burkholderia sp. SIMBA_048]